ncbi:MAG: hypothetical protein K9H49_15260 [Bacteroidales bacterium]|nr:hypothetical protein [Bacteroidales bacterium]MCF8391597.1 hypothetical protein [Bacteroidales bacterium]
MRLKILILFSFLALIPEFSFGQREKEFRLLSEYPSYEDIVLHFLKYHQVIAFSSDNFYQFRFVRQPKGWYVVPEFYDQTEDLKKSRIEIWTLQDGYNIPSSGIPAEIRMPEQYTLSLSNNKRYEFTIHPFYGYYGWDEDVINYFKKFNTAEMGDNELYGLSLAYSHRASNIFWTHSQYSDPELMHSASPKKADIQRYLRLSYKSVKYLKELYVRNPYYQTRTGLLDVTLANKIMAHWYELYLFNYYKEADKFLLKTQPHYDDFWVNSSEYLLQNIEENAILITNGDNDTYPHLWSQAVRNIRKDVLIINSALLNDPLYFGLLSQTDNKLGKLNTGLNELVIKNLAGKQLLAMNDTARQNLSYPEAERQISKQSYNKESNILMEYGYYSIPFLNKSLEPDTLIFLNASHRQISLPQFLLSGIVYYNFGLRPVYFVKNMDPEFQQLFSPKSLLDEGLVIRLTNDAGHFSDYYYNFDKEKVEKLLLASPVDLPEIQYYSRQNFYQLFLEMKSIAISYNLNEKNSVEKQAEILEYLKLYPPPLTGLTIHYYNLIFTLFQYDLSIELAQMFLKAYIIELENQIRDTQLTDSNPNDIAHLRNLNYIINSIIRSELEPGIPNFYENLFMLEKSINNKLRQMPEVKFD